MKYTIVSIFGLLLTCLPTVAVAHPIHVSVCEMTHDTEENRMEVTLKIFVDDFDDVLRDRTGEVINLGLENEHTRADTLIVEYLNEKFQLDINGQVVQLKYIGREIEDVAIWCYLYVPEVEEVETVKIRNEVMLHWFKDQVNVVHLDCNDKLNSTFFSGKSIEDTFSFK